MSEPHSQDWVMDLMEDEEEPLTASELSSLSGYSQQYANDKLRDRWKFGILARRRRNTNGHGGDPYEYTPSSEAGSGWEYHQTQKQSEVNPSICSKCGNIYSKPHSLACPCCEYTEVVGDGQ